MKTMTIWRILLMMLAAFFHASCHQSAKKVEAGQQADSTETVASANTLRLVVKDKELTASPIFG